MKTTHLGLRISEEQRKRLERLAQEAGVKSTSEVVRMLIDNAEIRRIVVPKPIVGAAENGKVAA